MSNTHRKHIERALEEAAKSPGNAKVGTVIARGEDIIATGFKGEKEGFHAEQIALLKAEEAGLSLRRATLYTTLEPCADSRTARVPCCELIRRSGITEVHIGEYDRNPQVYRHGWKYLRDSGVVLRDFPADLREASRIANNDFSEVFVRGVGRRAGAKFDFTQNGGRFDIYANELPDSPVWLTQWSNCGATAIYFYGGRPGFVAEARYATDFSEVDDPDALDYGGHCVQLEVGAIGVLRNEFGHLLCKVMAISPTHNHGGDGHPSVKITWEIRLKSENRGSDTVEPTR